YAQSGGRGGGCCGGKRRHRWDGVADEEGKRHRDEESHGADHNGGAGEAEIVAGVKAAIAEMGSPTMKEMGTVMKNAMAKFNAAGMRVDGKVVSDLVKKELAGR